VLFEEAKKRPEKAERYLQLAEKIGMKSQTSIPSMLKKQYCSECYTYLVPGDNCRVRINSKKGHITYTCENCGDIKRYGY